MKIKFSVLKRLIREELEDKSIDTSGWDRRSNGQLVGPKKPLSDGETTVELIRDPGGNFHVFFDNASASGELGGSVGLEDVQAAARSGSNVEVELSGDYYNEGEYDVMEFDASDVLSKLNL
jgi:hypothetical protein